MAAELPEALDKNQPGEYEQGPSPRKGPHEASTLRSFSVDCR